MTNVVGETAKIDVLKTENSVKVADIDKKLLPEDYHLENENAVVEIRKDDSKGEYIIVFVTDVTMTPTRRPSMSNCWSCRTTSLRLRLRLQSMQLASALLIFSCRTATS